MNRSRPVQKPQRPWFSSGPCVKPIEWDLMCLSKARLGQSHRSADGVADLRRVTDELRQLLDIPSDHWVGLTPGSATGALEMALWNLMDPRQGVDILVWDIFSQYWAQGLHTLVPGGVTEIHPVPGEGLEQAMNRLTMNNHRDLVLTWCGTTHGVWMGEVGEQALKERQQRGDGLIVADLASAVMTTWIPWHCLDVATFSWQKGLGGEAHLGVLVLGPRALERWISYTPTWPIPRLYRLKDPQGQRITGPFHGEMIHTCSMLLVQEYQALVEVWTHRGGQAHAIAATQRNADAVSQWLEAEPLFRWVVPQKEFRANGPVLLCPSEPSFQESDVSQQWRLLRQMAEYLAKERVAFDVINHARAFPALRLWCGPTVEEGDVRDLLPWLSYALIQTRVL